MMIELNSGQKVLFQGKIYDFGYYGQTGKAIIYEEGERNMQDSIAVDVSSLSIPVSRPPSF